MFGILRFGALFIGPAVKAFKKGDDSAAVKIFARGVLGDAAYKNISPARQQQMMDNGKAHRALMLGAGLPVFSAEDATAVQVPTQLVHGHDTPRFQQQINRRLAALIPGAKEVGIPNASHLVHEDNPQAVAAVIHRFCSKC